MTLILGILLESKLEGQNKNSYFFGKRRLLSLPSFTFFLKRRLRSLRSFTFFAKECCIFYILCKRTLCSLRSFMFFAKKHCILCVLLCSQENNAKECIIILGFISRKKLEKRMQKHVACSKRMQKSVAFRTQKNAVPNPDLLRLLLFYWKANVV